MVKENFINNQVNYYVKVNLKMANCMDQENNFIKMDKFILKDYGNKIKLMVKLFAILKMVKKWLKENSKKMYYQVKELNIMIMVIKELKVNGLMVILK